MTIYQGEKIVLEGYLKDDSGKTMDLSDKKLSFLLRKENEEYAYWDSTSNDASTRITIIDNKFTFTIEDALTKVMPVGQYTLEQKLVNADGTIVIGIVEKQIKIAKSNIGLK